MTLNWKQTLCHFPFLSHTTMSRYRFLGKPTYDPKRQTLTFPVRKPKRTWKHCVVVVTIWLSNRPFLSKRECLMQCFRWLWAKLGWKVRDTHSSGGS